MTHSIIAYNIKHLYICIHSNSNNKYEWRYPTGLPIDNADHPLFGIFSDLQVALQHAIDGSYILHINPEYDHAESHMIHILLKQQFHALRHEQKAFDEYMDDLGKQVFAGWPYDEGYSDAEIQEIEHDQEKQRIQHERNNPEF